MELSAANLSVLFTAADMVFQRGFMLPPSYYEKVASSTKSGTRQNVYPFMGRTTRFREWLGERVIQNLEAHSYTIINKHYEDTIGVDLDDISDDQFGVYEPMIEQLGWDAKVHPDSLLFTMIKNAAATIDAPSSAGAVIGYDGKTFFSTSHPVGLAGNTAAVSNVDSGGGSNPYWYLVDAARPIRPFIFQLREAYRLIRMNALTDEEVFKEKMLRLGVDGRSNVGVGLWQLCYASNQDLSNPANYGAAIAAMRSIKTDAGLPFGAWSGQANSKFLMVPPALEEVARQLLHSEFGAIAGAGAVAGVPGTNVWRNSAELIVSEYLA
jgi:phage major head subunit gpT-like protein